ncbi:MAG: enolase C-terminal domain-like protein [Pseudomonadota bacterium]
MTRDLDIVRARVYAVAPRSTPPYRWSGQDGFVRVTDNILRLTARNGLEGVASNTSNVPQGQPGEPTGKADRSLFDRLNDLAPSVMSASALEREAVNDRLLRYSHDPRHLAESLIDIALWDLTAKAAGLPLHRLLGGAADRMPAYASTPVFDAVDDYVSFVGDLKARGYRAAKLHTRCDPDWDLEMVAAVDAAHGRNMRFMLDVEQRYDLDSALRVGKALAERNYLWFEAPLPDRDLDAYATLRRAVDVPVLAAGNTLTRLDDLRGGIASAAWTHLRTGPTHAGGIGPARKAMALANSHGMTVELQSYGFEGRKLACLHMALGLGNCQYFEQPVPETDYEYEMNEPPRINEAGEIAPPDGPGLGLDIDWTRVENDAFAYFDTLREAA